MPPTPDPAADEPTAPQPRNWRLIGWLAVLTVAMTAVDQVTKWWAESELTGREPIELVGDLLQLRLLYNSGAAFSIATGMTWVLTLIVVVVIAVVIRASARIGSRGWTIGFGLLLGGAFGNLGDRLFREPGFPEGHVVDFIDYGGLFVGNVADIAITAAAVMIAVLTWRGITVDGARRTPSTASGTTDEQP